MDQSVFLVSFSLETIKNHFPPQAYRKGISLVSQGDVAGLVKDQITENMVRVRGFVHSEKSATIWYSVSISFQIDNESVLPPNCVCAAAPNQSFKQYCKHACALLLACIALRDFAEVSEPPKLFSRPNMKRFATACPRLQMKVDYHLTWSEILNRMKNSPPKKRVYSSNYDHFQTEPHPKKKKPNPTSLSEQTVNELKIKLREKGLPVSGKKAVLIERLQVCLFTNLYYVFLIEHLSTQQSTTTNHEALPM
jgi:SAP domain.